MFLFVIKLKTQSHSKGKSNIAGISLCHNQSDFFYFLAIELGVIPIVYLFYIVVLFFNKWSWRRPFWIWLLWDLFGTLAHYKIW